MRRNLRGEKLEARIALTSRMLADFVGPDFIGDENQLYASGFVEQNDELYFVWEGFEGIGLWKTDGTAEGTRLVRKIASKPDGRDWMPRFYEVGQQVLITLGGTYSHPAFPADDNAATVLLSDSTLKNISFATGILSNANQPTMHSQFWYVLPDALASSPDRTVFLYGYDQPDDAPEYIGPFVGITDGTIEGTHTIFDIASPSQRNSVFGRVHYHRWFVTRPLGNVARG